MASAFSLDVEMRWMAPLFEKRKEKKEEIRNSGILLCMHGAAHAPETQAAGSALTCRAFGGSGVPRRSFFM